MQFVQNGPDIPDALLQAHAEGRVVFFCGSGISLPAGLELFQGTVDRIYMHLGVPKTPAEDAAYKAKKYDATLNLLEDRYPGGRIAVRKALVKALEPNYALADATVTHEALLTLAKTGPSAGPGPIRLVTTNFDRVFDEAAARMGRRHDSHAAPMLPVPKNSRWNGLVYLHGVLPEPFVEDALHRLVLTSGDFGLAYLNERWAARFVSELFRNYIVCFVGYSIADPVMRYMMDALAADRSLGETTLPAYAFGSFKAGKENDQRDEWNAKGVTPVLYAVGAAGTDHTALPRTLKAWADTYRDGVLGRERIIATHALARPSASTQQDDFVGRMLWALIYETGEPAKFFAEFDPVPSLDWLLQAFTDNRFKHQDLSRFGVPPRAQVDGSLMFSLARRPGPYHHAPRMALVSSGRSQTALDETMRQLGRWLCRHLDDPQLLLWVCRHGGQVHADWAWQIERELKRLADLQDTRQDEEIERIRKLAPNGVPSTSMRTLWRLLLSGRVSVVAPDADLFSWATHFKRGGLTIALKLALRDLLRPRAQISEQYSPAVGGEASTTAARISRMVHWEIVLTEEHGLQWLRDMRRSQAKAWRQALPHLLADAQQLLIDALELMAELTEGQGIEKSSWHRPSITDHWQNRGHRDWTALIELTRDAWLATRAINPALARRTALAWAAMEYPLFQRLALFTASQKGAIDAGTWLDWLLRENARNLWLGDMLRETSRLLVLQGKELAEGERSRLEQAILAGPSPELYPLRLEPERWDGFVKRQQRLRLLKLIEGGVLLGPAAAQRLQELEPDFAVWQPSEHAREEFQHWTSGTGDPGFEMARVIEAAPTKLPGLLSWLQKPPQEDISFYEDTWRQVCDTKPALAFKALSQLAQQGVWPAHRWNTALQVWHEPRHRETRARTCLPVLLRMPPAALRECIHSLSFWMEAVAEVDLPRQAADFWALARTLLALPLDAQAGVLDGEGKPLEEPVTDAINHPVGLVTTAMLNRWLHTEPSDKQGLTQQIRTLFTQLCRRSTDRYRHGRVVLASRAIALFRVDQAWTTQHLLPFFDWARDPQEARAVWEGFLWSPRLYLPLLLAFKPQLMATAAHYEALGTHQQQFAAFIAYAALAEFEDLPAVDFRDALDALPASGLEEVAGALHQAMKSAADDQKVEYFDNRVCSFWRDVWPQHIAKATRGIAANLAQFCVAAGPRFDQALAAVMPWLMPLSYPNYLLAELAQSGLCKQFASNTLALLDKVLDQQLFINEDLQSCLNQIVNVAPGLAQDAAFVRLQKLARR
ncbi:hypothetical protein GN316_19275 [Xylophilus sp. Kf1]|nr:hypothetical protein [Xylophilus sp. Kf1]